MFQKTADQLDAWKAEMHSYEKNKRTKKPFGNNVQKVKHVTHEQIKERENRFDPVLQSYRAEKDQIAHNNKEEMTRARSLMNHVKQQQKYDRSYDIVNLYGESGYYEKRGSPQKLGPIRNVYNVINNQKMPDFHFKDRQMRLPLQREKNIIPNNPKEYNIITNVYNENHEERSKMEDANQKNYVKDKYWKTHDYDPVFGKFYDEERQKQFQEERKQNQLQHGKDYEKKLPPSYVYRQPFIPDPTKPLPSPLQTLDERRVNAKKRYRLKYIVEDEYNQRNFQDQQRKEQLITNKVHPGRILEQKQKQFNIITSKNYPATRAQDLYRKSLAKSSWQPFYPSSSQSKQSFIKTGGFK